MEKMNRRYPVDLSITTWKALMIALVFLALFRGHNVAHRDVLDGDVTHFGAIDRFDSDS